MSVLDLLGSVDWWQLGWLFTGLFLVLFLAMLIKMSRYKPPAPYVRKFYRTKIPSEYIIEEESGS